MQHSPSYIGNNLTTNNGELYAFINNLEPSPKVVIYNRDLLEKGEISQPQVVQWKDQSECFGVSYVYAQDKWHLCINTTKGTQIYNHNATRLLTTVESKKKLAEGRVNIFLCSSVAYD